jgi:ferritin-like metal-binding protein YciE
MASTTKKTVAKNNADIGMDLRELLVMKIRVLYGVESELLKALSAMAKKANDVDLQGIFEEHVEQTEDHMKRLLRMCELLGVKAQKSPSEAIRGLIADAESVWKNVKGAAAQDAALVGAACAIECHEIAGYETAIVWAKLLEKDEVADLLEQTLEEEDDFNEELGDLAELKINEKALPEGFEDEGEEDEDDDDEDKK